MSNWALLNQCRNRYGLYASRPEDGFNGLFFLMVDGKSVKALASDGHGWKHISVSYMERDYPPSWTVMCKVKDLFWEPEDWVVQYHPAKSEYISKHPGCLHLWQPLNEKLPTPPSIMVGFKELNPTQ